MFCPLLFLLFLIVIIVIISGEKDVCTFFSELESHNNIPTDRRKKKHIVISATLIPHSVTALMHAAHMYTCLVMLVFIRDRKVTFNPLRVAVYIFYTPTPTRSLILILSSPSPPQLTPMGLGEARGGRACALIIFNPSRASISILRAT